MNEQALTSLFESNGPVASGEGRCGCSQLDGTTWNDHRVMMYTLGGASSDGRFFAARIKRHHSNIDRTVPSFFHRRLPAERNYGVHLDNEGLGRSPGYRGFRLSQVRGILKVLYERCKHGSRTGVDRGRVFATPWIYRGCSLPGFTLRTRDNRISRASFGGSPFLSSS